MWRVWIEIQRRRSVQPVPKSPSVWRVWIEIMLSIIQSFVTLSPSVWRVWIEILVGSPFASWLCPVTLRVEGVD